MKILFHAVWILPVAAALFVLPMGIGVWLPDVFSGATHTLATTAKDGYAFRVVQYWNHVDFYTTEVRITHPDGRTEVQTVDGDSSKEWAPVAISVDPARRSVVVGRYPQFSY